MGDLKKLEQQLDEAEKEWDRLDILRSQAIKRWQKIYAEIQVIVRGESRDVSEFDVGDKTDGKHNCIKSDSWDNGKCQICGTPYHRAKL